jgi:hypothetical protein
MAGRLLAFCVSMLLDFAAFFLDDAAERDLGDSAFFMDNALQADSVADHGGTRAAEDPDLARAVADPVGRDVGQAQRQFIALCHFAGDRDFLARVMRGVGDDVADLVRVLVAAGDQQHRQGGQTHGQRVAPLADFHGASSLSRTGLVCVDGPNVDPVPGAMKKVDDFSHKRNFCSAASA